MALGTPQKGDNCGVASVANNAPASYPLGATLVTWTVTDGSGNTTTGTQQVVVRDTTPPTITCPADVTVFANAGSTATNVVLGSPATGDNCSVASVANDAPAAFPVGTNSVIWTARDGNGNTAMGVQTVTVIPSSRGNPAISSRGEMITITWDGGGVLQQSDDILGTYTDVPGAASPYTIAVSGAQKFYRTRGTVP